MNKKDAKGRLWRRVRSVLFLLPAWFAPHKQLRVLFHRLRGVNIGRHVEIGYFCLLDNVHPDLITIEDDAVITARATVLAHDNAFYYTFNEPVRIGSTTVKRNAFIGVNAVIMPTVTIGESAVVGANSVVTKDVSPYTIVAGIPARKIGKRDP